jgi:TatA/E family protein of Tat protein translocase
MFGSLGIPELILIFIVALIVFGPKRLPEIGRTLGKAMGEFKKATDDFKNTIEREVHVEELKQLATTTVPVQESVSRTEPASAEVLPAEALPAEEHHSDDLHAAETAEAVPQPEPSRQIVDVTPDAVNPRSTV